MRIDIHAVNLPATDALKRFAESRVWMAARRQVSRVAWVGLWLVDHTQADEPSRLTCRIDAWLRGIGHLTVRHVDSNIFVAVDIATARMEQAIARALRRAGERGMAAASRSVDQTLRAGRAKSEEASSSRPRLAIVIERRDSRGRLSLLPWLGIKYGIEQVSPITLADRAWKEAADGGHATEMLQHRLALSLLGRPELVVILGRSADDAIDGRDLEEEQNRVRRLSDRVRSWSMPVEVIGAWVHEQWGPDCRIESLELDGSMSRTPNEAIEEPEEPVASLRRSNFAAEEVMAS